MSNTIQATIREIDQKIAKLQQLKADLLQEFQSVNQTPKAAGEITRKQTLMDFISKHGPATRKELIDGTGIPVGTISFLLNDKQTFRTVNGRWQLR